MNAPTITNFRLDAALSYAERGWRVFPCHHVLFSDTSQRCSCSDWKSCKNPGKHPRTEHGLNDATTDPEKIRRWWDRMPGANVGIATGAGSGIIVLDVDQKHGGNESLAKLMDVHGHLPETVEVETGGGGTHFLFAHPGERVPNSEGEAGWLGEPGLDVRGDGGYVVAPPSIHKSQRRYTFKPMSGPGDCHPAAVPEWIMERCRAKDRKPTPAAARSQVPDYNETGRYWLGQALARCGAGYRNECGLWLACQLRDHGISEAEARPVMREYAGRVPAGSEPYGEDESLHSLAQAFTRPPRGPARGKGSRAVHRVVRPAPPPQPPADGTASELGEYLDGVIAGRIVSVPWPWPILSRYTQALLPGTLTVVCGDPSVGKTFFILQCLQFWTGNGFDVDVFFVEKDRKFYAMRLLAQLEGDGKFTNYEWIPKNGGEVKAAWGRHRALLEMFGKRIYTAAPGERVTLDSLYGWVKERAEAGSRLIVVDPITAVDAGVDRWTKDDDFVVRIQGIVTQHNCSLVLVTHPKKGNRQGQASGHDMAAGAAYYRFSDTTVWLSRPKKPKDVKLVRWEGELHTRREHCQRIELFFEMHKTRNGKGGGHDVGMVFGNGLLFAEQGLVVCDAKPGEMLIEA